MRQILLGVVLTLVPVTPQSSGRADSPDRPDPERRVRSRFGRPRRLQSWRAPATRSATIAAVLAVDPTASGPVAAADLQYRVTVEARRRRDRGDAGWRTRAHRAAGCAARNRGARLPRRAGDLRQHAAARSRSSTNCRSKTTSAASSPTSSTRRIRAARSAQGAGGGGAHLHPAQHRPVQEGGLRHLRDRRLPGVLRRAHRRCRSRRRP